MLQSRVLNMRSVRKHLFVSGGSNSNKPVLELGAPADLG